MSDKEKTDGSVPMPDPVPPPRDLYVVYCLDPGCDMIPGSDSMRETMPPPHMGEPCVCGAETAVLHLHEINGEAGYEVWALCTNEDDECPGAIPYNGEPGCLNESCPECGARWTWSDEEAEVFRKRRAFNRAVPGLGDRLAELDSRIEKLRVAFDAFGVILEDLQGYAEQVGRGVEEASRRNRYLREDMDDMRYQIDRHRRSGR